MDFKETMREGLDWNYKNQDRVQWRALVNTAMKHRVHKRQNIYD
jgi:hypothetical protein